MTPVFSRHGAGPQPGMQTPSRPTPKFSSFVARVPSPISEAGPGRTRDSSDSRESSSKSKKRHRDRRSRSRSPHERSRHERSSDRHRDGRDGDRNKGKERSHRSRRDELRAMDKIASRPVASQLEDRTRRPAQFTLTDTGMSYYDDPFGSSGALYLEVKYWPSGQTREVLGVSPPMRVYRDVRNNTFEARVPFHFNTRKDVARQFRSATKLKTRRLIASKEQASLEGERENGFIPIGKPKPSTTLAAMPDYRSILEPPPDANSDDDDSDDSSSSAASSDADEETTDTYSAETARLSRILSEDLSNTPAWLAVISHSASTNPTPQGRATIWLSMLEKALASHPLNSSSEALRLRYLQAVREVRSDEEDAAWERAMLDVKTEGIWIEYVSYRLVKNGPNDLEAAVRRVWKEIERAGWDEKRAYFARLRIFWRAMVGLQEAGYFERVTAAIQAQIELSYFAPPSTSAQPFEKSLDDLESFWDSEVPRIGEVGAQGWAQWVSNGTDVDSELPTTTQPEPSSSLVPSTSAKNQDGYQRWAAAERDLDARHQLSVREDTDDPYFTILFSDIRGFLFPAPPSSSFDILLLLVALSILGLHVPGLSAFLSRSQHSPNDEDQDGASISDNFWSYTSLLSKRHIRSSIINPPTSPSSTTAKSVDELINGKQRQTGEAWGPIKEWSFGALGGLLEGHGTRGQGRMWEERDLEGVDVAFVRRIFERVDSKIKSPEWAEYWIAFEAASNVKEAIKLSKTLLASYPHSLKLWSAHAYLQRIRGKADAARKVYETCLQTAPPPSWSSSDAIGSKAPEERAGMYWSWAEMEWLEWRDDAARCFSVLFAAVGMSFGSKSREEIPSPMLLLRARRAYDAELQSGAVTVQVKRYLIQCRALLELVLHGTGATAGSVIPRVLAIFNDNIPHLSHQSDPSPRELQLAHEQLALSSSLLIHRYTHLQNSSSFRPADIRAHLSPLIRQYPSNTLLLGIWLESEKGEGDSVWGRVRSGIAEDVLGTSSRSGLSALSSMNTGPTTDSNVSMRMGRFGSGSGANGVGAAGGGGPTTDVLRWVWAIWTECCWERGADNGNVRARAMLKDALQDPRLERSPTLWRLFVDIDSRVAGTARVSLSKLSSTSANLKGTIYQACAACPWVKDLYMQAFELSRPTFTTDELGRAVNTMAERGIRLRATHSLEEYLSDSAESGGGRSEGEDDWGEMEIEHKASELARLKPY